MKKKATPEQIESERADDASALLAATSTCDPQSLSNTILCLAFGCRRATVERRKQLASEIRRRFC